VTPRGGEREAAPARGADRGINSRDTLRRHNRFRDRTGVTCALWAAPRLRRYAGAGSDRYPLTYNSRHMTEPLIYYKPCHIGDTYFRECLTCGAIVKNEGLHTIYHEQQVSPKRCPKCGLLDIGRHICRSED
jgi:hypothetical protein